MADTRIPMVTIDAGCSTPLGEDKCTIIDMIADGTCKVGFACMIDETKGGRAILATVGKEYGVVIAGQGLELGDTPTAGTKIRVCVKGPVVANVVSGLDNFIGGLPLCAHATDGHFIPPVATANSATSASARLLDWRAGDVEVYALIDFMGLTLNSNTDA